jgi:hypothetical protein
MTVLFVFTRHDAVQYNDNDKLCLNGQRLIVVSSTAQYGAAGTKYNPEMSPTTVVTLYVKWTETNSSFIIDLGNGHTQTYDSVLSAGSVPYRTAGH